MEWELIIQLGIGGLTLFILREYLLRTDKRIDKRDEIFMEYVQSNNHKVTDLVVESTNAIKESTNAIKASSELICKASKTLEDSNKRINEQT